MAQAYVPIQTVTVGSGGAASIEFTNIPQTYTDLKIVYSTRNTGSADPWYQILIQFNSDTTAANYPYRYLYNASGTPGSGTGNQAVGYSNSGSATASTFSNGEIYIPNYTSTTNKKSISGDVVNENNSSTNVQALYATLWDGTAAAITSIKLTQNANNFAQYSTATLYGIGGTRASGGTVTADGRYTYHTFTSTGTFTANEKIKGAEVLVIAGGGGGGSNRSGGGGGAGGLVYSNGQLLNAGSSYTVVVGAGGSGAGSSTTRGSSGGNSLFGALTASVGGGGGGSGADAGGTSASRQGGAGGSGGGGGGWDGAPSANVGGTATSGQGNNGGSSAAGPNFPSGGGGGASAVGESPSGSATTSGNGGAGSSSYSSWGFATNTGQNVGGIYWFAGGAGGGGNPNATSGGTAGNGGGGAGGANAANGTAGTTNTGGGGGGSGLVTTGTGANGGSGLVIIRYPN